MPESNGDRTLSLKKILNDIGPPPPPAPAPPADEPEAEALTIAQMDGKYSTMRPANKPLTRIHVVLKDGSVRSYQYHFLDVESTFDGNSFTLIFAGTKHYQITVKGHGKMFWAVYDYCTLHRWPYLREATRDFGGGDETVLTEIKITDITPKPE